VIVVPDDDNQQEVVPIPADDANGSIGTLYIPPSSLPPGAVVYVSPARPFEDDKVNGLSYIVDVKARTAEGDPLHDFSDYGSVELCFATTKQVKNVSIYVKNKRNQKCKTKALSNN
jgi:hypothetical protein